jgi:hypothetical protein
MESSVNLTKDFVTILVPVVTGYIVLFPGSIDKLWLEHRKNLGEKELVLVFAGLSVIIGILRISFCMGVMSLLLKATYGSDQSTFWMGVLDSRGLVEYAHKYLMIRWGFFVLFVALGLTAYFYVIKDGLKRKYGYPEI